MIKNVIKLSGFVLLAACTTSNDETDYEKNNTKPERGGAPNIEEVFKMDTDGDGKLAKSDVSGKLQTDFDKFDTNGDGFISRAEFEAAPKPQGRKGGRRPRN